MMPKQEINNTTLSDLVLFACHKFTTDKEGVRQEELSNYLTKTFSVETSRVEQALSNLTKKGYINVSNEGVLGITHKGHELMIYTRLPKDLHEKLFGEKEVLTDVLENVKVKENERFIPSDAGAYTVGWHHAEKENVVGYK